MKRRTKIRKSKSDQIFDFIIYTVAILMLLVTLYPMYFILIASFSNPSLVGAGRVILIPKEINFGGYQKLLSYSVLWIGYRNTIFYALAGTLIILCMNIPAGFALSRKELPGRKWILMFYIIPMFFSGGMIPTYMILQNFKLLDTLWVMILPFSVSTYYIIVARTFFNNNIPDELWDAAQVDGCGSLQYFFKIALPLSKAVLAVIALWAAVGHWNSYFNALLYLRDDALKPLQLFLRSILINNQYTLDSTVGVTRDEVQAVADQLKYAVIIVSSAPIMCLYPFVQKYFNQGVMVGSIKG